MAYLAIRNGEGQGVYIFNTNGEKSRILSKFPGSSTRVFTEDLKENACKWANVEDIVDEEKNKWAITKVQSTIIKEEIMEEEIIEDKEKGIVIEEDLEEFSKEDKKSEEKKVIKNLPEGKEDTPIPTKTKKEKEKEKVQNKVEETNKIETIENKEKQTIISNNEVMIGKHVPTDFERILEIYKKMGSCMLKLETNSGQEYCIIPETFWFLSRDARKYRANEESIPIQLLNSNYLKEVIYRDCKIFRETGTGPKNPVIGEILSTNIFSYIQKTKYLAFGDLIYFNDVNFYNFIEALDEENRPCWIAQKQDIDSRKHVTIHTSNIKSISLLPNPVKIEGREYTNILKKAQKELELEKQSKKN